MAKNPSYCVAVRSLNPLGHTLSALSENFLADNRLVRLVLTGPSTAYYFIFTACHN